MGDGLASRPTAGWRHCAFTCAAGEDAVVHKGFACRDMGDYVLYNVHLQADHAIGWGNAADIRGRQLWQLRQHMATHGARPVIAVGDFNHVLVPETGETCASAQNGLDGALARNVPGQLAVYEEDTDLSDHPMVVVSFWVDSIKSACVRGNECT